MHELVKLLHYFDIGLKAACRTKQKNYENPLIYSQTGYGQPTTWAKAEMDTKVTRRRKTLLIYSIMAVPDQKPNVDY